MKNTPEYLRQIIDSIADPVFVKDKDHRWVFLNTMFCEFMGQKLEDLIGKTDHDFFPKKEADVFWKKDAEVFAGGQENVNEEFFTDGAGIKRTIVTKKTLYTDSRGDKFIVGIIRDVSDQRQATHELKETYKKLLAFQGRMIQSEKMASLGQLVAGIAHEINNPTAYILSNLYTLQQYEKQMRDFFENLPADRRTTAPATDGEDARDDGGRMSVILHDGPLLIRETVEGAQRIKKIVEDLKVFAHPGDGGLEHADLHACIDRALGILTNQLKYKAKIVREYGDLPRVCFREQQMLQVFMNLLSNAVQAIEESGTITITTRSEGRSVVVKIKDTGSGISPENLPRVFDPFFTTKPVGQGTGLGLAMVHSIIEKHKGTITVASDAGEGTLFTITLLCDGPESA